MSLSDSKSPDDSMEQMLDESGKQLRRHAAANRSQFLSRFRTSLCDEKETPSTAAFSWKEWILEVVSRPLVPRLGMAAMIALVIGAAGWGYLSSRPTGTILVQSQELADGSRVLKKGQQISTGQNQHSLLLLDDSRVECYVGGESQMRINGREEVVLDKGEAWLSITPQSGHFAVDLPRGTIHVMGTSFGIHTDENSAEIFLARGKITYEINGIIHELRPDHLFQINWTGNSVKTSLVNEHTTPGWVSKLYDNFQVAHHAAYFPSLGK
jgi:ferric-dicitrate binding protein FerR (iron transport regulator)